jgi:transcriptional regulator with XRE-family HTH domain
MPDMPDVPDWMTRLTQSVAQEVRRNREQRGMSAQQLSDACGKLGLPIHRAVISNFENGRRGLSIGELMVIAKALDVAPVFLLFPVGFTESIEMLPGQEVAPVEAIRWFAADMDRRSFSKKRALKDSIPYQLVMDEDLLAKSLAWDIRNGLHEPGQAQAYIDNEPEYAREQAAAQADLRVLTRKLARIERAEEDASPEEIAEIRRELQVRRKREWQASYDATLAHDRMRAAEHWLDEGGLEAKVEELSAIRREMARRGMLRPALPEEIVEFFDEDVR